MMKFLYALQVVVVFQNIISLSGTTSSDEKMKGKKKRPHTKWTSERQNSLIEICKNILPNEPYYSDKVRKKWHELHPDYKISADSLRRKMHLIPKEITGRVKRPEGNFKWDDEKNDELANIYLRSNPYNISHPVGIHEEWERRHPDFPKFRKKYLASHARKYLDARSTHAEGESSRRLFEWTDRKDSDLYHIHHVTLPKGRQQPVYMHKIWADLYPDHRDLTYDQLAERIRYLQRKPPDEHFPWTKGQNKELLEIYHSTSPEVADQGQRIYDIWSKIHPRYNFMTPYYLQVHASTLAINEETMTDGKKVNKLTNEQKKNLIDMYRRLTERQKPLYDFHKMWVREYPALAHITGRSLASRAKKLITQDDSSNAYPSEGDKLLDITQSQRRKYRKYTSEEKAELLSIYHQTNPRERGHCNRIFDEWAKKRKNTTDIQRISLKRMIQKWIREDSYEKGKAPIVTPKVEEGSESPTSSSNSSK